MSHTPPRHQTRALRPPLRRSRGPCRARWDAAPLKHAAAGSPEEQPREAGTLGLTPHGPPRAPRAAPAAGSSSLGAGSLPRHPRPAGAPGQGAGTIREQRGSPRLLTVGGGGGGAPFCFLGFVLFVLLPHGGAAAGPAGSAGAGGPSLLPAAEEDPGEGPALPRPARLLQTAAAAVIARLSQFPSRRSEAVPAWGDSLSPALRREQPARPCSRPRSRRVPRLWSPSPEGGERRSPPWSRAPTRSLRWAVWTWTGRRERAVRAVAVAGSRLSLISLFP